MIDWQGNKVNSGDIVVFTCIRAGNAPMVMEYDPLTDSLIPMRMLLVGVGCFAWREYLEALVIEHDGILHMDVPGPNQVPMMVPVNFMWEQNTDPDVIFCVKGKSDNEKAYFKKYFRYANPILN